MHTIVIVDPIRDNIETAEVRLSIDGVSGHSQLLINSGRDSVVIQFGNYDTDEQVVALIERVADAVTDLRAKLQAHIDERVALEQWRAARAAERAEPVAVAAGDVPAEASASDVDDLPF